MYIIVSVIALLCCIITSLPLIITVSWVEWFQLWLYSWCYISD